MIAGLEKAKLGAKLFKVLQAFQTKKHWKKTWEQEGRRL